MKRALHPILVLIIVLNTHSAFGQPFNDNWNTQGSNLSFPFDGLSGHNFNATTQPLEQDLEITGSTVWWFFNAPSSGTVKINTFGSDFDTVLHVYTDFQNGFGNFTQVAANDDAPGSGSLQSQVTFLANAGQCYEIRVGGFLDAQGDITLEAVSTPPVNDNWAGQLLTLPIVTTGTNVLATVQPLEQDLEFTDATVWWHFNANFNGTVTINTFGSDFDTILHVYADFGNGFGNLTLVAVNDDTGGGFQSQVSFPVNVGQFYEIRVGGIDNAQGNITLSGSYDVPPANDNWPGPFLALPFVTTGTNVNATVQPLEQDLGITGATVWWHTEAPGDGMVTIDTFGSVFDTVLHVYTDSNNGFGDFTLVAANDDFGGFQSQVMFPVNAGQLYEIRVGGFLGSMGQIDLMGTFTPGSGVLLGDVNLDGVVNLLDVTPFVNVVTGGGFQLEADINRDGLVNLLDVTPFIAILTG